MSIEFNHPVWDEGNVWREESWTFHSAPEIPRDNPAAIDFCVFEDGVHYPGQYCPHYNGDDPIEEQPGWTVLDIPKGH